MIVHLVAIGQKANGCRGVATGYVERRRMCEGAVHLPSMEREGFWDGNKVAAMRIYSWNVNGLRACARKGFRGWLDGCGGELVCLQETRVTLDKLDPSVASPPGWHVALNPASRPGYSGVGVFGRSRWDTLETSMGREQFDCEGRLQLLRFGALLVANVYFPNGSGINRDNSRIPYKLDFYSRLFSILEDGMRAGERILVVGDMNTAHRPEDLARPRANVKTSGFRPEEREELDRWLDTGWVDTFRAFEQEEGHYTWWSNRPGVRERNVGWRIDYMWASPGAMPFVTGAFIHPQVMGSDHCPIGVDLDPAILEA